MGQLASDVMLAGCPPNYYVRLADPTSDIPLLVDWVRDAALGRDMLASCCSVTIDRASTIALQQQGVQAHLQGTALAYGRLGVAVTCLYRP